MTQKELNRQLTEFWHGLEGWNGAVLLSLDELKEYLWKLLKQHAKDQRKRKRRPKHEQPKT